MASIGPYILEAEIGRGGMGAVFRARHAELDRVCALKVIPVVGAMAEVLARRFEREARLMTRVVHPGLVRLYDFGQVDLLHYIAMELLEGTDLEKWLKERPAVTIRELDIIALGIARGVGALHEAGIVHRDLKPGNIMIQPDGEPKVMDLGLARADQSSVLTQVGAISGTPAYMPPEAGRSSEPPPSYDVYAIGLILHRLYTTVPAFEKSPMAYVLRDQPIPEPRISAMEHSLGAREVVIRRCLDPDPANRPQDAEAIAQELVKIIPAEVSRQARAIRSTASRSLDVTTVVMAARPRRSSRPAFALAGLAMGVVAFFLHQVVSKAPIAPRRILTTPTDAPPAVEAMPPSCADWMNLRGTARLEDALAFAPGPGTEPRLLSDRWIQPFAAEVRESLMGWEQNRMVGAYYSDVEYWPDPPLEPAAAAGVTLVPLEGRRPPVGLTAPPPGPVRRLVLRLRPGERYRLTLPGGPVEIEAPPYTFARDLWIAEGFDDVILMHASLGRDCRLALARSSDGSALPPLEEPQETPGGVRRVRQGPVVADEDLTVLIFDGKGPSSRTVLARIGWKKGRRDRLLSSFRPWMTSITSILRRRPDRAAEARTLVNYTSESDIEQHEGPIDMVAMVMDFRNHAHPEALRMFETCADSDHPQLRRGGIYALSFIHPRRHIDRFARALARGESIDEDLVYAAEALGNAGDPRGPAALLARLRKGRVSTDVNWVWSFARTIPQEVKEILREPSLASTRVSPRALPLLDQLAGYLGGPDGGRYLASLPDERLVGARHFSLVLMLRLIGTDAALERLEALARTRGAGPGGKG